MNIKFTIIIKKAVEIMEKNPNQNRNKTGKFPCLKLEIMKKKRNITIKPILKVQT